MSVLTAGETMVLLDPVDEGEPAQGARFQLRIAGAESNVAVALTRLGVQVAWVSRVGDDAFGRLVADTLALEGLDLRWLRRDPAAPTGLFFKFRSAGRTRVLYYRRGSAASRLRADDVPDEALAGVRLVHLTGITTALSESTRELVVDVARRAREHGITVCFDPNYRSALWGSPAEAAAAQREVLPFVDWVLCGLEEGNLLFGTDGTEELVDALREAGAGDVAVRVGAEGAFVRGRSGLVRVPVPRLVSVFDEIGAGDGFAAGFSYGLLQGWGPSACAAAGNVIAAAALAGTGDWETFPRLQEVRDDLERAAATGGVGW
jgi:sugar/nucleoside kinase (ribokinase family)